MTQFKKVFLACVIGATASFGLISNTTAATSGTVNFSGSVVDDTCQVDSESLNVSVELGTVKKSDLSTLGANSGLIPFEVKLTNCPIIQGIQLAFDGVEAIDGLLEVNGGAEGVAIGLLDMDGMKAILIGGDSTTTTVVPDVSGDVSFNLAATYVAISETVVPGTANATATFEIVYP